jgi:hypothetical protein
MNPKLLPTVMVTLSLRSSIGYLLVKDYRHAIYWFASAILIASVTY